VSSSRHGGCIVAIPWPDGLSRHSIGLTFLQAAGSFKAARLPQCSTESRMISGVLVPLSVSVIASPRRGRGDLAGGIASAGCARLAMTANESI